MLKKLIKKLFRYAGYEISNARNFDDLLKLATSSRIEREELRSSLKKLLYVLSTTSYSSKDQTGVLDTFGFSIDKLLKSKSQLFQDLFVLFALKEKRNGFFVEFGATDGVGLSNTFLLEKEYGWNGILAEPGKVWEARLRRNRNCIIDTRCIWSKTGDTLSFSETEIAELSTISEFADSDSNLKDRKEIVSYDVETISLNDLLEFHKAPREIDYVSIDTEGSEYKILSAFDFSKFDIKVITVEHNYSTSRKDIFRLLVEKGYRRVFSDISVFDDWYINDAFFSNWQS